jgi:carbonic anhydrase
LTESNPNFSRYPVISGVQDNQSYFNQVNRDVNFNGHTSQIDLQDAPPGQLFGFTSSIPRNYFGAPTEISFNAKQFHFHSPSEHTYDGNYFDLEMHTVHLEDQNSPGGFMAAALGIMFDVRDYNAELSASEIQIIDTFFDSFQWDQTTGTPIASYVPYADLVNMVDFDNRWVYQGSVTTPPCAQKVFWNQITTVYPIKQRHLDQFKAQLARKVGVYAPYNLAYYGNFRELQREDFHNVHFVSNPNDPRRRIRGRAQ